MPQLDPTFWPTQLFWLAVTFIVLYLLMSRVALPRIGEVLEERQNKIDDNLEKAAQLKAEAEAAVAAYEKALTEARANAQALIRETTDQANAEAARRSKELSDALAERIKASEARIAEAKDKALANLRAVATDVAAAVAEKLTGAPVDGGKVEKAVDGVMQERA